MPKNSPLLVEIGQGLFIMLGLPAIAAWVTKSRPQKAKRGTFGFNLDTNSLEYWDGVDWFTAKMTEI